MPGQMDHALAELSRHVTLRMNALPTRVPLVGGRVVRIQDQLGRLLGATWHTYDLLLQQNTVNSLVQNALRRLVSSVVLQESQLLAMEAEHRARIAELEERLRQKDSQMATVREELGRTVAAMQDQLGRRLVGLENQLGRRVAVLEDQLGLRVTALERERRVQQPSAIAATTPVNTAADGPIDYFGFELKFRGNRKLVRERQGLYLDVFARGGEILDIGCGRGEFVELMNAQGARARGIELNPQMVGFCQSEGLPVEHADAISYLQGLDDDSLDGVFCAQVIEHVDTSSLVRILDLCHAKLRSGAPIVLETPNPLCLSIYARAFYQDPTHVKPVHPATLQFLLEQAGFWETEIRFSSPFPESERLGAMADESASCPPWMEAANENVRKLNDLLFGCMDYAAVARKVVWPRSLPGGPDQQDRVP
jgi:O-antigen chain-terminating methyltransferase